MQKEADIVIYDSFFGLSKQFLQAASMSSSNKILNCVSFFNNSMRPVLLSSLVNA